VYSLNVSERGLSGKLDGLKSDNPDSVILTLTADSVLTPFGNYLIVIAENSKYKYT